MDIDGVYFPFFLSAALIAFYLIPVSKRKLVGIPVISLIYLLLIPTDVKAVWPILVLVIAGYILARLQVWRPRSGYVKFGSVFLLVSLFVYFKGYTFLEYLGIQTQPFFVVGMSYLLFRLIHIVIDTADSGEFAPKSFAYYFSYLLYFPTLSSGPVQLYPEFEKNMEQTAKPSVSDVSNGMKRMLVGYIRCIVFSKILWGFHQNFYTQALSLESFHVFFGLLACLTYLFYLYINFSGYIDVVISTSVFLGMPLPENFIKTFSARNFLDLWGVWHMTMSNWFKMYLFNPIVKKLAELWPNPNYIQWYGVVGFFTTFFVMGLWHGTTFSFIIYGFVLGAGVSVNKWYQIFIKQRMSRQSLKALKENFFYKAICRGAAYSYFAMSLMCFWLNSQQLAEFYKAMGGWVGIFASYIVGSMLLALIFEVIDAIKFLFSEKRNSELTVA